MPKHKKEKHLNNEEDFERKKKFKDHGGHHHRVEKNKSKTGKHSAFETKDCKASNPFRNQPEEAKNEVTEYLKEAAGTSKPWTKFKESRPEVPVIQKNSRDDMEPREDNPFRNPKNQPTGFVDLSANDKNHYRKVITKLCAKGKAAKDLETAVSLMRRRLEKMQRKGARKNAVDNQDE